MRIVKTFLVVLLSLIALIFGGLNVEHVIFNYYFGHCELPLSILLFAALSIGIILGLLINMIAYLKIKSSNALLVHRFKVAQDQQALKDSE